MQINDWDTYFMELAALVATKSKDPSTKIGSIIVGPDHEIRSTGYNGAPRGFPDDDPALLKRPDKYFYFAHSERNAIYNAARVGTAVGGCSLYTLGVPCSGCAVAVINAGIVKVVVLEWWEANSNEKWLEEALHSSYMFQKCGVEVKKWTGGLITPILTNGIEWFSVQQGTKPLPKKPLKCPFCDELNWTTSHKCKNPVSIITR